MFSIAAELVLVGWCVGGYCRLWEGDTAICFILSIVMPLVFVNQGALTYIHMTIWIFIHSTCTLYVQHVGYNL